MRLIRKRSKKRSFLLLEVLLCLLLISMCFFPLLYPHFAMRKIKTEEIATLALEKQADLLFVELKEKLYNGQLHTYEELKKGGASTFPTLIKIAATKNLIKTYQGSYTFNMVDQSPKNTGVTYLLLDVKLTLTLLESPKKTAHTFPYALLVEGRKST